MTYVLIILAGLAGNTKAAIAIFADRAQCETGAKWVRTRPGVTADAVCLPGGAVVAGGGK